MSARTCSICNGPMKWMRSKYKEVIRIYCPSCGEYEIARLTEAMLPETINHNPSLREALPAWIDEVNARGEVPLVDDFAIACATED